MKGEQNGEIGVHFAVVDGAGGMIWQADHQKRGLITLGGQ